MAIIGFSFSKFNCERAASRAQGSIDIKHNISVKDVTKTTLNVGGNKNDVLKVDFSFDIVYGGSLGKILIEGDVIFSDNKDIISETFKAWEADKKLPTMVNEEVFKFVYTKSSVKALELSDSLNLPSPIPLPKISFSSKKN